MKLQYQRELAMLYDLIGIYTVKLNPQYTWINRVVGRMNSDQDLEYIQKWEKKFRDPDPELLLFFYLADSNAVNFIKQYSSNFFRCLNLKYENFLGEMNDIPKMKKALLTYYIDDYHDDMSLEDISKVLTKKDLPGKIAFQIIKFCINPVEYLQILICNLKDGLEMMDQIYQTRASEILKFQELITEDMIIESYAAGRKFLKKPVSQKQIKELKERSAIYSCALIMKNAMFFDFKGNDEGVVVLGYDFQKELYIIRDEEIKPELIGNAIGDPNRAAIMEYAAEKGHVSASDIAKQLGAALNTTVYHLEIMRKAGILNMHREGKTNQYWINPIACQKAAEMFQQWSIIKKGEGHEEME